MAAPVCAMIPMIIRDSVRYFSMFGRMKMPFGHNRPAVTLLTQAIGARDRDVLRVFLLEASALGFAGGAVGVTAGWLLARAVASEVNGYLTGQGLAGVQVGIPATILLGGVVCATLLSIIAGTLPAVRAARLPAREAVSMG